jgi:tetratricopeptide (TPR) repeat protein
MQMDNPSRLSYESVTLLGSKNVAGLDEAVAMVSQLRYGEAAEKFTMLAGRFETAGDQRRAAESTFWLGYCYEKLGRTKDAGDCYQKVLGKYPATPAAARAADRVGNLVTPYKPATPPAPKESP